MLFAGESEGRVDSHRRIAVPAVFAEALSGEIVVALALSAASPCTQLKAGNG